MKPTLIAGIVVITLLITGTGLAEGNADFRKVDWGMSPEQVKKAEPADQITGEMPEVLIYKGEIAGIRASIFYLFDQDKLTRGLYSIETGEQDMIVKDYETIRTFMLKQYGEPAEVKMGLEKEISTDELDPENPDDLYTLVLKKFLSPEIIWKKGGTQIYLRLTEKDGLVAVMIDYIPNNFFPMEKE